MSCRNCGIVRFPNNASHEMASSYERDRNCPICGQKCHDFSEEISFMLMYLELGVLSLNQRHQFVGLIVHGQIWFMSWKQRIAN